MILESKPGFVRWRFSRKLKRIWNKYEDERFETKNNLLTRSMIIGGWLVVSLLALLFFATIYYGLAIAAWRIFEALIQPSQGFVGRVILAIFLMVFAGGPIALLWIMSYWIRPQSGSFEQRTEESEVHKKIWPMPARSWVYTSPVSIELRVRAGSTGGYFFSLHVKDKDRGSTLLWTWLNQRDVADRLSHEIAELFRASLDVDVRVHPCS